MRPVSVFAKGPGSEIEQLRADLQGRWRQAARGVMVLLSAHGLAPAQIAELLDCHPATVRRWIGRFNDEGLAGLADRSRCGRPRLGGGQLTGRIAALLERPGPWALPRIRRYLGWPQVSARTVYRRVRLVAIWRRPKLAARGDPYHDHVVAGIVARLIGLPRRAVVLAEDETHLNLLPHVRASWTLHGNRPQVLTPGTNRKVTVLGQHHGLARQVDEPGHDARDHMVVVRVTAGGQLGPPPDRHQPDSPVQGPDADLRPAQ